MLIRNVLVVAICFLPFIGHSQYFYKSINDERTITFKKNNIYIVYSGNATLDSSLASAFHDYWTVTPIKGYISEKELKTLIRDKQNSFIYLRYWYYPINRNYSGVDGGMFCFNGGEKNLDKYNVMYDMVANDHIDVYGYEKKLENVAYRCCMMVKNLNDLFAGQDLSPQKKYPWKDKILLINEKYFTGKKQWRVIKEGAFSSYPYKYEIASEEKIQHAVKSKDPKYMLLVTLLSDMSRNYVIYDLASWRIVMDKIHSGVFPLPMISEKEVNEMVESMR